MGWVVIGLIGVAILCIVLVSVMHNSMSAVTQSQLTGIAGNSMAALAGAMGLKRLSQPAEGAATTSVSVGADASISVTPHADPGSPGQ